MTKNIKNIDTNNNLKNVPSSISLPPFSLSLWLLMKVSNKTSKNSYYKSQCWDQKFCKKSIICQMIHCIMWNVVPDFIVDNFDMLSKTYSQTHVLFGYMDPHGFICWIYNHGEYNMIFSTINWKWSSQHVNVNWIHCLYFILIYLQIFIFFHHLFRLNQSLKILNLFERW